MLRKAGGKARRGGAQGQVLLVVVVLVAAGFLIVTPLLALVSGALSKGQPEREQRYQVLAAEAAIARVKGDLVRGADGIPTTYTTHRPGFPSTEYTVATSYTPPSVTIKDYTAGLSVTALPNGYTSPPEQYAYFDPGVVHPHLATVPAGQGFLMRVYNVQPGYLTVNWAYNTSAATSVGVWAGMPGAGSPIPAGQVSSYPTDTALLSKVSFSGTGNKVGPVAVDPASDGSLGVYTIVFFNNSGAPLATSAFLNTGGAANTWVNAIVYRDYVVTATVGAVTVQAHVRQVPGFTEPPAATGGPPAYSYTWSADNVAFIRNDVFSYSWLSP